MPLNFNSLTKNKNVYMHFIGANIFLYYYNFPLLLAIMDLHDPNLRPTKKPPSTTGPQPLVKNSK